MVALCGSSVNNSVSTATGLAPNEIHLGRMPRLPINIIEEYVVKEHMGEKQDQLLYLDIVWERQQRAFEPVQESHLIFMSKVQRSNTKLLAILHKLPNFEVGNWVWIYNSQATVTQGVGEENSRLMTKPSLNWTGPYKILVVGPGLGPHGRPIADKTLYLDLSTDMPGRDQKKRVYVDRCKMCHNPSDDSDIPKYLPAGRSKYVLHSFTTCNIAMSKGDFDVNTRTSGLGAPSPKSRLKQGGLVLVREADSALRPDGVHAKLTYGRWT